MFACNPVMLTRPQPKIAAAGGGLAYTYRGGSASVGSGPVGTTATYPIDIGTASVDRLIVVGAINDVAITGITVNGVALTLDVTSGGDLSVIYSGLVTSGSGTQNVVVTTVSNMQFASNGVAVWALTGLSSNVVKHTTTGSVNATISATAGDFMFCSDRVNATLVDFSLSTELPAVVHNVSTTNYDWAADWTVAATNASFGVFPKNGSAGDIAVATYR